VSGNVVKECRDEITVQKSQIEKLRRETAIDQISGIQRIIDEDSNLAVEKGIAVIEKMKKKIQRGP
jgi:hypothetical protein